MQSVYIYDSHDKVQKQGGVTFFAGPAGMISLPMDDPTHNHGPINIAGAISYLNSHACYPVVGAWGYAKCATYVINALVNGGGAVYDVFPAGFLAKDYGPTMLDMGFDELGTYTQNDHPYTPVTDDVVIFQPWTGGGNSTGHIAMYNGTEWVCDYFQGQAFYPRAGSANATDLPAYTIYRYNPDCH